MNEKLSVDVWSDVACPWCYLGKRTFEKALEGFDHADDVEVTYHSFQLNPDASPDTDEPVLTYLARRGFAESQARQSFEVLNQRGAPFGISYDFDHAHQANTRRAHRLIHFARLHGADTRVIDDLFSAFFEKGVWLGDDEQLVAIGVAAGLLESQVRDALESEQLDEAVQADIDQAAQLGIQGVPFFVLNGRYGISGAQPVEAFAQALDQVWSSHEEENVNA